METGVMDQLRICQEERDILKQKLHIHLDRWTLDKIMFEDMAAKAAREIRLKEAEKSYEIARREMRLGSQQQQLLVLKIKLDSALEDVELKEAQFSALKSQLHEERKWQGSAKEKLREMKARFTKKVASEKSKLVMEAERKSKDMQKLLDYRVQRHKAEVEQIEGKHVLAVIELKEEIKHLVSRDDHSKAQQIQSSLERERLQALARERDDLRAKQEQWHMDKKELHELLQERDYLRGELEKWNSRQEEMQAIKDERDRLVAEKDQFASQLLEMFSRGEDLQEFVKEADRLKHELDLSNAQRQGEISALVRERDFVWSQMKNLDEDYVKRIKRMSEQNLQDRQEIDRLKNEIKGAQVGNNEMMVEMTILKLEVKRVEDLAIQQQRALEAELQELQSTLERVKEEKQALIADALKKESVLLELSSRKETLERQLDYSYQEQAAGAVGDSVKEVPEVLNAGDVTTLDHDILESQIDQATQVHRDDEKKPAKSVEDLRRENENLRLEIENLKVLYVELEDAQRKKPQKPGKVTNKGNQRDPTSRNLKLELEAAASCCPLDESPITDGKVRRKKRRPGNQKPASGTNSSQRKGKDASSKSGREEGHSSDKEENTKRNKRRSKAMPTNGKYPSDENNFVPSPKTLRPRTRVDYSDSIGFDPLNIAADQKAQEPVDKRRRVDDGAFESTQNQRPPLHTLFHNQRSSTKSAVRTSSSSRGPLLESSKNTFVGSPTKTSKVMVNYFSTAFNVPKLKTPVHFMTGESAGKACP